MPTAGSGTTFQSVSAIRDILVTHSPAATDPPPHHQDQWTHVDHPHVESMQNAERETELPPVLVCQDCLEIPTLSASQSAQSTLSAPLTRPVSDRSAWTHVLEFVGPMQDVQFRITTQAAHVTQDTPETPSDSAPE